MINTTYKFYRKIIHEGLCFISDVLLLHEQAGFCKDQSCTDDIFYLKMLIEKRREMNLEIHLAFSDYKKTRN